MFGFSFWKSATSSASACCASGLAPGSRPTTLSVTLVFGSSVVELESPLSLSLEEHATSVLLSASAPAMANAAAVREYFIVAPGWVGRHPACVGRTGGSRRCVQVLRRMLGYLRASGALL